MYQKRSFRVGRVRVFLRGRVWYLQYHEHGKRRRPRAGSDRSAARQLAAQINGQLEMGAPSALSFEPVTIETLRERWLRQHDEVKRSSVQTICRYRTATQHFLRFAQHERAIRFASHFQAHHAEDFVRYLRTIRVAPGHPKAKKRPLMDKGVVYILECCRAMFGYAGKHRHLSPYAENPFTTLDIDAIPVEEQRPLVLFQPEQERAFLNACDDWQFPMFLTLMLTGIRSGELTHLLLPDDLDLVRGSLFVRNKKALGWQVKTRNEREIPLVPILVEVLGHLIGDRREGLVFRQRAIARVNSQIGGMAKVDLERHLAHRVGEAEQQSGAALSRAERMRQARIFWRDMGAVREDGVRLEFMRVTKGIGLSQATEPKALRHLFATCLQDANVDPLVRNELMGHSPGKNGKSTIIGMTAVYTHTRPETKRRQLEEAMRNRPAIQVAENWLGRRKEPQVG